MVAQTKADVRNFADKPVPSGRKGVLQAALVDGKELLDDQAAAAAVVDAEQAEAVAAQVAADGGIMPTEAPTQSIGEVAQATTPTTTDTPTTTSTTPPAVEEGAAGMSPWAIGGIALLGVGAIAVASNSGDSPAAAPPPVADQPPPPPPPPGGTPPANVAPTSADSQQAANANDITPLSAANFPFADTPGDTLSKVKITGITPAAIDTVADVNLAIDTAPGGHGYELVTATVTWAQAVAAAAAKGGYLAKLDTTAEMQFIQTSYDNLGTGAAPGTDGTWAGASQGTPAASPGDAWTWAVDSSALPGNSPVWNGDPTPGTGFQTPLDGPNTIGTEDGEAQFAAIFNGLTTSSTNLLYDFGTSTTTMPRFLIEYDNPNASLKLNGAAVAAGQEIAAADVGGLSWNSVFNTGGTITYAVADSAGAYSTPDNTLTITPPPVAIGTMIDDQQLNVLA